MNTDSPLKALSTVAHKYSEKTGSRQALASLDLVALASDLKTAVVAYELPEDRAQCLVGMTLVYYAIHDGGVENFAPVETAFTDNTVYPQPESMVLSELRFSFDTQLNLARGVPVTLVQEASDPRRMWRFLICGEALSVEVQLNEFWNVSPGNRCNALGNHAILAKEGYVVPGVHEGCLVIGTSDGLNDKYRAVTSERTQLESDSDLKAVFFIANDDLPCQYGAGFEDNVGTISVRVECRVYASKSCKTDAIL